QAQAILDLRLNRLTGLEQEKIREEYQQIILSIQALIKILSEPDELHRIIREELAELKDQFGDARRTVILDNHEDFNHEDLIEEQDMVVTLSQEGYIKSQSLDSYEAQHRGGRGKAATLMKEQDFIKNMLVANSHDTILCFSTQGKVYWLKVYEVPESSRTSRGRPMVNLLPLAKDEQISAILPVKQFQENHYVFMATQQGLVKKVQLSDFAKVRTNGKIALDLNEGDFLIGAGITNGQQEIMLVSDEGKAIRFPESAVRPMGRAARGVMGMRLGAGQKVMTLLIVDEQCTLLTATSNGYGQRTSLSDYRAIGRGGQGVRAIQVNERNGKVVAATQVYDDDEVLLISDQGTLVRIRVSEVSVIGRNTQGVRLIQLASGEQLVGIESVRGVKNESPDDL
ncbi:MAG: DNA gyrase subunit A, partial [Proteobacteria bacterium]|nr:DNA gyrase subunit A [Pseudomonadota bacterium]